MKILVLGAGGMAGHAAVLRLAEHGHAVTGLARRALPFCDTIVADVTEADALRALPDFDAVVNGIGALNTAVDAAPYEGIWLNACLPHLLAERTRGTPTRIVHLSTDCVFSGRDGGGYPENGYRSADTMYGRAKALGELNDDKNLTFRTSIVGPDVNEDGAGLFHWFMRQTGAVAGYTGALWTGVTTVTLADAIDAALRQGLRGLYHLVNGERISKCALLKLFNALRADPVKITPCDRVQEDKSLVNTRADFAFSAPSYEEMVRRMGDWIRGHREIYGAYRGRIKP
jgi:dTDP-4-dehydrorhamnose reductase